MKAFRPSLTFLLAGALVALVPLLAVLQYRWVGQISQAERDRMRASLDAAVRNFTDEFDRELARLYLDLQLDLPLRAGDSSQSGDWRARAVGDFGARYRRWLTQAAHPQLVKDIYLAGPHSQLSRFDRSSSSFVSAGWPDDLLAYRPRFEQNNDTAHPEPQPLRVHQIQTVIEEVPALVVPIPNFKLVGDRMKLRVMTSETPFPGFIIAVLDSQFIRHQLLPELAARYFSSGGRFDYNVSVVRSAAPEQVIYKSDEASSPQTAEKADAIGSLFRLRFEMPRFFETLTHDAESKQSEEKQTALLSKQIAVQYFNPDKHQLASQDGDGKDKTVNTRIALIGGQEARWQVLATHRAGSLDAAVASVRRRNLIVSFSILLVLSMSIALIVLTSRRAARLARQQMEFVAGISHELRTPLAVIRSAAENLADGVIEDRGQVKQYGQLIEDEGRRLSGMVEQTLEFAGIQSARRSYALQPSPVADVIADAVASSQPLLEENLFELETSIDPALPPVAADRTALAGAIQNLISNAIKYSGDVHWVKVSARLDRNSAPPKILIEVEDRGLGISPSELRHVFEPFYRGRDALGAQIRGNGLGLSLVRHIVKSHGGDVHVDSQPRRGSRFTIKLPAMIDQPESIEVSTKPSGIPRRADS
jgi:signal transduction histidine kinase